MSVLSEWRTFTGPSNYALRRFGCAKEIDWGGKLCYIAPLEGTVRTAGLAGYYKGAFLEDQTRGFI
jgi:hypothetical protein